MPNPSDRGYALVGLGTQRNPYDARRSFAYSLLQSGMDASPIQSPWQGAARLAQALAGGWAVNQANEEEALTRKNGYSALAAAMAEPDPQKRLTVLSAFYPSHS